MLSKKLLTNHIEYSDYNYYIYRRVQMDKLFIMQQAYATLFSVTNNI